LGRNSACLGERVEITPLDADELCDFGEGEPAL
jgi:hypothetical protein